MSKNTYFLLTLTVKIGMRFLALNLLQESCLTKSKEVMQLIKVKIPGYL